MSPFSPIFLEPAQAGDSWGSFILVGLVSKVLIDMQTNGNAGAHSIDSIAHVTSCNPDLDPPHSRTAPPAAEGTMERWKVMTPRVTLMQYGPPIYAHSGRGCETQSLVTP